MEKEILEILKSMQYDIRTIKSDMQTMQSDVKIMQSDIKTMQSDIKIVQSDIKTLDSKVSEHTELLRALEHSAQVNKAEHDNMKNDIIHIKGTVESINKDLSRVEEATAHNWMDIAKLKAVR